MSTREEIVQEAWDNAIENGYGDWLKTATLESIAVDMLDCSSSIGDEFDFDDKFDREDLLELIEILQNKLWKEF